MCYSVMYSQEWKKLKQDFGLKEISENLLNQKPARVFPQGATEVLISKDNEIEIENMIFSLVPSWSKTPKVNWSTYNARLNRTNSKTGNFEKIFEIPTWRDSFNTHHCILPVTEFYESCREGLAKNFEVSFHQPDRKTMYAAGIYSFWKKQNTEFYSFAAITQDPSDYIKEVGHDRMPIFLNLENAKTWLQGFESQPIAYNFLVNCNTKPTLKFEKIRPLKSS